jgi:hypothetical protein
VEWDACRWEEPQRTQVRSEHIAIAFRGVLERRRWRMSVLLGAPVVRPEELNQRRLQAMSWVAPLWPGRRWRSSTSRCLV